MGKPGDLIGKSGAPGAPLTPPSTTPAITGGEAPPKGKAGEHPTSAIRPTQTGKPGAPVDKSSVSRRPKV